MKKILIFILVLIFILPFENVHADSIEYSEWSTEKKGYSREEEAIQYGVMKPIWTDWFLAPQTNFDFFYEQTKDFGSKAFITNSGSSRVQINNAKGKTIYIWNFGETVNITYFYIDVDCWKSPGSDENYAAPAMRLYVDDKLVASVGSKNFDHISDNWGGHLNVLGKTARLDMSDCSDNGRDMTTIVYSYIQTSLIKYRYVIGWEEPTDWRFDLPYEIQGLPNPQKAVERKVYRYPLNPTIEVEDSVLFEESTYEYIKDLATATDYDDEPIPQEDIEITKFEYIIEDEYGNNKVVNSIDNPKEFDPSLGDKLRVTYVAHGEKCDASKTVTMIIIKEGILYDLKIYDRYIDSFNYSILNEESKWKQGNRRKKILDAFKWLERK